MKAKYIFIFMAGMALGSGITYKIVKTKCEEAARDEINAALDELFESRDEDEPEEVKDENVVQKARYTQDKPDIMEIAAYTAKVRESGYTNYSEMFNGEKPVILTKEQEEELAEPDIDFSPCVIAPEEYGDIDDYDRIELTYYASDEVLADDNGDIIDDLQDVVGVNFAKHFGEYEDDSVHIRNDRLECYYEILYDSRCYSDVVEEAKWGEEEE